MAMSKVLNAAAHGHIHETIGGSWNHYFADEAGEETDNVLTFAHEIQVRARGTLPVRRRVLYCHSNVFVGLWIFTVAKVSRRFMRQQKPKQRLYLCV